MLFSWILFVNRRYIFLLVCKPHGWAINAYKASVDHLTGELSVTMDKTQLHAYIVTTTIILSIVPWPGKRVAAQVVVLFFFF